MVVAIDTARYSYRYSDKYRLVWSEVTFIICPLYWAISLRISSSTNSACWLLLQASALPSSCFCCSIEMPRFPQKKVVGGSAKMPYTRQLTAEEEEDWMLMTEKYSCPY